MIVPERSVLIQDERKIFNDRPVNILQVYSQRIHSRPAK